VSHAAASNESSLDATNEKPAPADAVKVYLVDKGLDPAMVATEAKAEGDPVAPNDTPAGRARNRRAEIRFEGVRSAAK
jgi:hypothetical protein